MRNQDNFQNSWQYIINQLFILNYNNSDDLNDIKMKLWVLDGPIRQEEFINDETPDKDVNNPMNHWETLLNDLRYIDKFYRTEEGLLDEREDPFDVYWDKRIIQQEKFVNRTKPDSDERYEDWEQPYSSRPSLLSKDNIAELYQLFNNKKSNGELNDVFDIVNKATNYTIDHEAKQAETAVINHIPAEEMEAELVIKADENKVKNDDNYVKEMKELHTELASFIEYIIDEFGEESEGGTDGEETISWEYLVNVPTERVYVNTNNANGHRGPVIELGELKQGGYRFVYKDINGNEITDLTIIESLELADLPNDLTEELEKGWENLLIVGSGGDSEGSETP